MTIQEIRTQLKSAGYNTRKVSIRVDKYSMGRSYYATIRDLEVDADVVKEIVNQLRDVRRCSVSGDILSGGNTYVDVDYSEKVIEQLKEMYEIQCEAIKEFMEETDIVNSDSLRIGPLSFSRSLNFDHCIEASICDELSTTINVGTNGEWSTADRVVIALHELTARYWKNEAIAA